MLDMKYTSIKSYINNNLFGSQKLGGKLYMHKINIMFDL